MPTLPPSRDQTVELLVKATSSDKARAIVIDVSGYTLNATVTKHSSGYYVFSDVFSLEDLNGSFYDKVKKSDSLAILSDSSQKAKRDIVLEEAEKVENQLRKLLLRANGFIEDYYNLFLRQYTHKHADNQTAIMSGNINPITSLLTFDMMIIILETDISWSQLSVNSPKDILKLIEGAHDLTALREKLNDKMKEKRVWDVISESVLRQQFTWKQVAGKVNKIKELRNRAAHFQILTDRDVKDAQQISKAILSQLGESNQKAQKQISYAELPGIQEWLKSITASQTGAMQAVIAARDAQLAQLQIVKDFMQANQPTISQLIANSIPTPSIWAQPGVKPKDSDS